MPQDPLDEVEPATTLTEDDIRERSASLDQTQELWEELSYMANPKMPCPECGGQGALAAGSLGNTCVRCMGSRVIEVPGGHTLEMPPFATMRQALGAYGDALALRQLPEGHKGRPQILALPAASTVPTLEQITILRTTGIEKARTLQGLPGVVPVHQLPEPKTPKGLAGEGDLGEYDDAELADIEADGRSR